MSISGPSGDQSHAVRFAVRLLASVISRAAGYDCQKFFTLTASPPLMSPTNARPVERAPATELTQVLFVFVRLTIVKPSGVGCDRRKSFQMAFCAKTGLP